MTREEILNSIYDLSKNQGFYSNFYQQLQENPEILDELKSYGFRDVVDLILKYYENI